MAALVGMCSVSHENSLHVWITDDVYQLAVRRGRMEYPLYHFTKVFNIVCMCLYILV